MWALCAPTGHTAIWRRFQKATSTLPHNERITTAALPSETVIAAHPDNGRALAKLLHPAPARAALLVTPTTGQTYVGSGPCRGVGRSPAP